MRHLKDEEERALLRIAEKCSDEQRWQIVSDIKHAVAEDALGDGSRLILHIDGYTRPPYKGQHQLPAEGRMLDADSGAISVMAYADGNNRIFELELIKWGESEIISPIWESLTVD